ncbi:hypothetical protein OSG_eHP32_00030 [environmental Halophage eHP-32]|nr:hypothetical protein OSG_eHP32_00030 [environmental Halophage eHP-32]
MTSQYARPWYCRDSAVNEYRSTISEDGERLPMLKTLKILRAIIVNIGVIGICVYAITQGGDPTLLGTLSLLVLGGYNGLELSDYAALLQAYDELQSEQ